MAPAAAPPLPPIETLPPGTSCACCWHPADVIDPGSGAPLCAECASELATA